MSHPSKIQLIELASKRLSAEQARELMKHVGPCPQCALALRELEHVHRALGNWRERTTDIELVDRVLQAIDTPVGTSLGLVPSWLRSSAVAASLLASLVGGHLLARGFVPADEQGVVPLSAIEDHLQLAALSDLDPTGMSAMLDTETDFDGVTQ